MNMKKNNLFLIALVITVLIVPQLVSAQMFPTIRLMLVTLGTYVHSIIRIVFGLAIIYFFWGMSQFILHAGYDKTREDGKQRMIWGVIALFVMISIYGIIAWIGVIFGIGQGGILELGQQAPVGNVQSKVFDQDGNQIYP